MGRPEAHHEASSSNLVFHQTHCENQSEKPEHQVSPPNPSHCQAHNLGCRLSRAENDEQADQQQEQAIEHNITPRTSSCSSQEIQANQTHPQTPPLLLPRYHHNVQYYFPTPISHHGTKLSWHNFPNQYAPPSQFQAIPPGLRPHPTLYPPPLPSPSPSPSYYPQLLSNYSPSQPLSNYSGTQQVQPVVLYPPPAAYHYPSSSTNPYVHYNRIAATGIPMMQNLQFVPGMMPPQSGTGEGTTWKTGLCDCFLDPQNAIMTLFFPWWTFGRIAEIVDNGQTACSCNALIYLVICCFVGMPCFLSCTYRRKLRTKFDLPESPPDFLIHLLCEPCALCQEHRELELRGLDPSLGWVGCLERLKRSQEKRQGTTIVPPTPQRMMGY